MLNTSFRTQLAEQIKNQIKPIAPTDLGNAEKAEPITCEEIREILNIGGNLIDVRSPKEFASSKVHYATNIPLVHLVRTTIGWDKTIPVLVYCNDGAAAELAKEKLLSIGFINVTNIGGVKHYNHCS